MRSELLADLVTSVEVSVEINLLLNQISQENRPFAVWKLPEHNTIHLIAASSSEAQQHQKIDLEALPAGFVAAPFNTTHGIYFIPANEHWAWQLTPHFQKGIRTKGLAPLLPSKETLVAPLSVLHLENYLTSTKVTGDNSVGFQQAVRAAIAAIQKHAFQKVVLSRQKIAPLPSQFSPVATFLKLCRLYPTAFVSFFAIPKAGVWMGASPEVLVSVEQNRIFRTMALAGTQVKGSLENLQHATWTQKEIAEQAMVSRYIINCFKKIRLREFEENGPRTVAAGNLIHLRTDFEVDMLAVNFPQLGTVMLELLHPTSAVCGLPKEPAAEFITRYETYDRALYSGYIGGVNIDNDSHLFVNLRCMQLQTNHLIMYAGAGITEDSEPAKEWQETEIKCQTMFDVINPQR
ncbi:MAG: chorismate-binding protein [Cytophagales bacterium]|nr:chorismate-binding protein [Bernardetiaceae bacterium]MDW8204817.1 chorismate-binding protein [Cytophagales bacterium]